MIGLRAGGRVRVAAFPTAGLLVTACSMLVPTPKPTAAPLAVPAAAATDFTVGRDRPTTVVVPPGLDPAVPAPLLVLLHGYNASGAEEEAYLQLGAAAAEHGVLYVHPDGTRDAGGARAWNATDACCDVDGRDMDDSTYLAGLIREIGEQVAVDPSRVYVAGHSNGAFMSYRMACDHADVVAAIASIAGAPPADDTRCQTSGPVAILQIQGTDDDQVRVDGGSLRGILAAGDDRLGDYPSLETSLRGSARRDGCRGDRTPTGVSLDLDTKASGPDGPAETVASAYADCALGGAVELWLMDGVGHEPAVTPEFARDVIAWLLAHPKPA